MKHTLYTVTLTDLGTYTATVAAGDEAEAARIAKTLLFEEAITLPSELQIVKREADTVVTMAPLPCPQFLVSGTYTIDFDIPVPAANAAEAERHARRLYEENCGPYEFLIGEDRVRWHSVREAAS